MKNIPKNIEKVNKLPDQTPAKTPLNFTANDKITKEDIYIFLDTYFPGRNKEIKTILGNFEDQDISTWAKVLCSTEFREIFPSKKVIEQLPMKDLNIFIKLFLMIPLNYIYWREIIKYENTFPITDQHNEEICWVHAIATLVVFSLRKIIGRKPPTFDEVMEFIFSKFERKKYPLSEVLPTILSHYNLHYYSVPEDQINVFNPNGSYNCHLCRFSFTGEEWANFSIHFHDEKTKNKALISEDLCKTPPYENNNGGGHAVVLIDSDKYKHTCRNSWGPNWANNGQFTFKRGAIKNAEFYVFYWFESELPDNLKTCYYERTKKCISIFYQIIEYINELMKMKSDDIKKVRNEHIIQILRNLCEDFWNSDEIAHFRSPVIDYENVIHSIFIEKEINDLSIFGNPCVKSTYIFSHEDFLKEFSLISVVIKRLRFNMKKGVSITDTTILNFLNVFKHAYACYPEYLKECINDQIPGFSTYNYGHPEQIANRNVGEGLIDTLVWLVTDLWMKNKISGEILKQVIFFAHDLQQQGFLDPAISDHFLDNCWNIVKRPGWKGVYKFD